MRPAIKWVDEVKGDGFGRILPSELLQLVEGVRNEMRQAAWVVALEVAQDAAKRGDLPVNQAADAIAVQIARLGK